MVVVDLMFKATEWGAQVVQASNNAAQRRGGALIEKSAIVVAGLQHMDRRFTGLFVPLVFYDSGSWPLERRRAWAEEALAFIHGDRVVDRLGQAITYLEGAAVDDRHLRVLVLDLCEITRVALWGDVDQDVSAPPEPVEPDWGPAEQPMWWTWADSVRDRAQVGALGLDLTVRHRIDPDSYVAPAVSSLVTLIRGADPDPQEVARAASDCLVLPRQVVPRDYRPAVPRAEPEMPRPAESDWSDTPVGGGRDGDRATPGELGELDNPGRGFAGAGADRWPAPLNTVSPLRDFADLAGRRFQQILLVVRESFPGLPEPAWLWESGT